MKRNRLKIRIWLTMALTAASLALASSASAMFDARAVADGSVTPQVPVAATPSGFNWADAAIGAAVALALGLALAAIAIAHIARHRSRLVASH